MDRPSLFDAALRFMAMRLEVMGEAIVSEAALASLGGMAAVLAIEPLFLGTRKSSVYRLLHPTATTKVDLFYYLGKVLGYTTLVVLIFTAGLPILTNAIARRFFGFEIVEHVRSPVVQGLVVLAVGDFIAYWTHWARHRFGWWWEVHKLHHSAEEFNAITTARGHPLDIGAITVTNAIPFAMLGGSIEHYAWVALLMAVHAGLSHSMLPWSWGWFGRYVLVSPIYHRIHHSALPEHRDKNLASIFPIWDVLFGTQYRGDRVNAEVGVDDNHFHDKGVLDGITLGMRHAGRAAFSGFRRLPPPVPVSEVETVYLVSEPERPPTSHVKVRASGGHLSSSRPADRQEPRGASPPLRGSTRSARTGS